MNPLLPGGSGTTPEPTRNASDINQGTNEDDSQYDPHPEASLFHGQREQNSGTERDYDNLPEVFVDPEHGVRILYWNLIQLLEVTTAAHVANSFIQNDITC